MAQVVERWNAFAKIRQDLFGCIDIVSVGSRGICGIQACARSSVSARLEKAQAQPGLRQWLASGGLFLVQGWGKVGRGRKLWQCREIEVRLKDDGFVIIENHPDRNTDAEKI